MMYLTGVVMNFFAVRMSRTTADMWNAAPSWYLAAACSTARWSSLRIAWT